MMNVSILVALLALILATCQVQNGSPQKISFSTITTTTTTTTTGVSAVPTTTTTTGVLAVPTTTTTNTTKPPLTTVNPMSIMFLKYLATNKENTLAYYTFQNYPKQNFSDAQIACKKIYGRVMTNASPSSTKSPFRIAFTALPNQFDRFVWAYPGTTENSEGITNCKASFINKNNGSVARVHNTTSLNCSTSVTVFCEKPVAGQPCFVNTLQCGNNQQCMIMEGLYCGCKLGFSSIYNQTTGQATCKDTDECASLQPTGSKCINVIGTYKLYCQDERQWNGTACYYVVSLSKIVNKTSIPPGNSAWIETGISNNISSVFQTGEYEYNSTHANNTFDVYVKYNDISPNDVIKYYKTWLLYTPVLSGHSIPDLGPVTCSQRTLAVMANFSVVFHATDINQKAYSVETCPGKQDLSRATVMCKSRVHKDGTTSAYFDYATIYITDCDINIDRLLQEVNLSNLTTTSTDHALTLLNGITVSGNDTLVKNDSVTTKSETLFVKIADQVAKKNITVTENSIKQSVEFVNKISYHRTNGSGMRFKIVSSLETLASRTKVEPGKSFQHCTKNIQIQIQSYNASANMTFNVSVLVEDHMHLVQSFVPAISAAHKIQTPHLSSSFIYFSNSALFPKDPNKVFTVDQVLSASIAGTPVSNLLSPMWYQMQPKLKNNSTIANNTSVKQLMLYQCAFYNTSTKMWSDKGCSMIPGSNPPRCACNHLTNFAVLVQTHVVPSDFALNLIGYIGCSLSILGLTIMVIIYLSVEKLRSSQIDQIHIHMSVSLLVMYIIFLAGTKRGKSFNNCVVAAAFLHYFILCAWCWMCVQSITMYKKFVKVFGGLGDKYVHKCCAVAYTLPALTVIIAVVTTVGVIDKAKYKNWHIPADLAGTNVSIFKPSTYISNRLCWIHLNTLYFAFLVPVGLMMILNYAIFIKIFLTLTSKSTRASLNSTKKVEMKDHLIRGFVFVTMLGLTWIFAIPLTATGDETTNLICSWLFSVTNALQGFFIFILFCIRRKEVRKIWLDPILIKLRCMSNKDENLILTSTNMGSDTKSTAVSDTPRRPAISIRFLRMTQRGPFWS